MNVGSGAQIRQLLFAGVPNSRPDKQEELELERIFKVFDPSCLAIIQHALSACMKAALLMTAVPYSNMTSPKRNAVGIVDSDSGSG